MPKKTAAPASFAIMGVAGLNSATQINTPDGEPDPAEVIYNRTTDERLASRRGFLHDVRTHAEVAAATSGDLPLGTGLSLRMAMAGQGENDQFPYSTDEYGKQRS